MMKPSWAAGAEGDIAAGRTPVRGRLGCGCNPPWRSWLVLGNWYLPSLILTMLINAIGMVLLIVWTFIIVSRLHLTLKRSGSLAIRMPGRRWVVLRAWPGHVLHARERRGPGSAGARWAR